MNTLMTAPCSGVVARLFAEADESDAQLDERRSAFPQNALAQLMKSTDHYRSFYEVLKDFHLAVSRETATLLYMLPVRSIGSRG